MSNGWPEVKKTEADWRADLRSPLPDWQARPQVEWLRLHRIEQGDRCHYCTARFADRLEEPLLLPTLDHIIPRCRGGADSFENTVAACWLCNVAKSAMMPDEASERLPHVRVVLLNRMLLKRKRAKRREKERRQRARRRAAKLTISETS